MQRFTNAPEGIHSVMARPINGDTVHNQASPLACTAHIAGQHR
jgi:hypothetical protein